MYCVIGIKLEKLYTKQIKCIMKNLKTMRSVYSTIISLFFVTSLFSQITYDTSFTRQWNNVSNDWEDFDRIITTYDNGLVISELIQTNQSDVWVNYNLKAYYYSDGHVIEEFEQYWNDAKLKWEDNYRKIYSYDREGKLTHITHQNIFKGKYVNATKEIMIYTPEGKLKEKVIQKYEKAWTNFLRYQYYYNSNDLLLNENLASWDGKEWENDVLFDYKYNEKNSLAEKTKIKMKGSKKINMMNEEFCYTQNGVLNEHLVYLWDKSSHDWTSYGKSIFVNSDDYYVLSMLTHEKKNNNWKNYFITEFSGNYNIKTRDDVGDCMTFAIHPADFGNFAKVEFYNPFKEVYHVSIMNADGELIAATTTDGNNISVEADNLIKGLYFVELQGSNLYSGKFSIE
jgi:hypothetical protein